MLHPGGGCEVRPTAKEGGEAEVRTVIFAKLQLSEVAAGVIIDVATGWEG